MLLIVAAVVGDLRSFNDAKLSLAVPGSGSEGESEANNGGGIVNT